MASLPVAAGGLVWSDRPSGTKAIRSCNFDGTNVRNIYSSAGDPRGVIVDAAAERVYFCDRFAGTATSGEINSVPLAGGARQQHVTALNRPADLRFDFATRTLYWCEENEGLIRSATLPLEAGTLTPHTLFNGLTSPYYLDFDAAAGKLVWGSSGSTLLSGPLSGGTPDLPLYTDGLGLRGVCVDAVAGMLYWVERDARVVRCRAIAGGTIQDLYTGLDTPHGLVLDLPARKLYWVDTGTAGVGGFNARGVSRGELDGASAGAAEIIVAGTSSNQPWDIDLDLRTTNYTEWAARFFRRDALPAVTDRTADPDRDGVSNWVEYVFGSSPVIGASMPRVDWRSVEDRGLDYPAAQFRRRAGASDLTYRLQISDDLVNWEDNSTGPISVLVNASGPDVEGMETITERSLRALGGTAQQFLRVCVTSSSASQ